ncbi:MAG TPA: NAD(P)H-hydrate dehydratase [Synergistales bacterium]|nr:NAD(P)H-hydrate dehydratase [Synergistales bacterium]HOR53676.1 NAD(P)H-hydrate dehydratase [Synergistales bacterium]HPK42714.1 NAD(P)H-hydrate dehydratase [Synergistales bacterium]
MFLYNAEDIRQADRKAVELLGMPPAILMENAGKGVADAVKRYFPSLSRVLIACGGGNNGGDGLVAARHLLREGYVVTVLLAAKEDNMTAETKTNLGILQNIGCLLLHSETKTDGELTSLAAENDLVIDGLLGTGSKGAPRGEIGRVIRSLDKAVPIVAIDLPSGVDPSTGEIEGEVLAAKLTVAILARKIGHEVMPGRAFRGDLVTTDLGVEAGLLLPEEGRAELLEPSMVSGLFPPLSPFLHKGDRGAVLVIGGSERYRGAPVLSALGALMGGSGVVIAAVPADSLPLLSPHPEIIPLEVQKEDGVITPKAWDRILDRWGGKFSAVVLGPGLDRGVISRELVRRVWVEWKGSLCLDGDALHALSCCGDLEPRPSGTVITPHEGEAGTLLSTDSAQVGQRRLKSVQDLSSRFGVTLLKGPCSLVSDGRRLRVNPHIVPGLSVPGSGDVLSGLVGAFLAMGIQAFDAAAAAAFVHGSAGEFLQNQKGPHGITASEVALALPSARNRLLATPGKEGP